MNIFAIAIIILFILAAVMEAINGRWMTCSIYFLSSLLNVVFLLQSMGMK
jgi:hypothetical protein